MSERYVPIDRSSTIAINSEHTHKAITWGVPTIIFAAILSDQIFTSHPNSVVGIASFFGFLTTLGITVPHIIFRVGNQINYHITNESLKYVEDTFAIPVHDKDKGERKRFVYGLMDHFGQGVHITAPDRREKGLFDY